MGVFHLGRGLQLVGMSLVGLCMVAGIHQGDYGRADLARFLGGILAFLLGSLIKGRGRPS